MIGSETQQSITEWCVATFGQAGSNFRVAARANEEMAELLRALSTDDANKAAEEAADVAIVLARLATRLKDSWELNESLPFDQYSVALYAVRANEEMSRLLTYLQDREHHQQAAGCIQWCINWLRGLCLRLGTTLRAEIDRKMKINRERRWSLDGSGHGYHVRDK